MIKVDSKGLPHSLQSFVRNDGIVQLNELENRPNKLLQAHLFFKKHIYPEGMDLQGQCFSSVQKVIRKNFLKKYQEKKLSDYHFVKFLFKDSEVKVSNKKDVMNEAISKFFKSLKENIHDKTMLIQACKISSFLELDEDNNFLDEYKEIRNFTITSSDNKKLTFNRFQWALNVEAWRPFLIGDHFQSCEKPIGISEKNLNIMDLSMKSGNIPDDLSGKELQELYEIKDKFFVKSFKEILPKEIKRFFSEKTVLDWLAIGLDKNDEILIQECLNFMNNVIKNYTIYWHSIRESFVVQAKNSENKKLITEFIERFNLIIHGLVFSNQSICVNGLILQCNITTLIISSEVKPDLLSPDFLSFMIKNFPKVKKLVICSFDSIKKLMEYTGENWKNIEVICFKFGSENPPSLEKIRSCFPKLKVCIFLKMNPSINENIPIEIKKVNDFILVSNVKQEQKIRVVISSVKQGTQLLESNVKQGTQLDLSPFSEFLTNEILGEVIEYFFRSQASLLNISKCNLCSNSYLLEIIPKLKNLKTLVVENYNLSKDIKEKILDSISGLKIIDSSSNPKKRSLESSSENPRKKSKEEMR